MTTSVETKKLTVRVDARWLESAKAYAGKHGTSLSKLISEFLREISEQEGAADTPVLQRLSGILPADATAASYGDYLDNKYG